MKHLKKSINQSSGLLILIPYSVLIFLYIFRYTKLRIFALKLKKKLNETITQLQLADKDKARLEKLLSENKSAIDKDENDGPKTEIVAVNLTQSNELEEKVKSLTVALEDTKNNTIELDKLKGMFMF